MSDQDLLLAVLCVTVIASFFWHRVAGIVGLIICGIATWTLSEQMHLINTVEGYEDFSGVFIAFIGLLFVMRYRMKRREFDNRTYDTGTGTYYPSTGTVTRNYSTGFGRAFSTTVIGGMFIIVILAGLLSAIRFGG